ncbi:MAG TPA: 16S rRNA (guanine(966)-N(2))-methyltransferase RsmD [Prolixibacteraceae bacterium]|nr:16S rRNA (guanine(966)-N(2))-methyltransferase RsmD [Prolixibacteraceae bacterium]
MRITGGKYRGRSFHPGSTFSARPTTDFAKESLFNILANTIDFENCKVLDLFSGTGSIGYEFLSRGTRDLTLVELNFQHVQFIKSVIQQLGEKAKVYRSDVFRFIESERKKYDLIFADPPYDHPRFPEIPERILNRSLLEKKGILIIEHSKAYNFSHLPGFYDLRKYGSVHFSFFRKD